MFKELTLEPKVSNALYFNTLDRKLLRHIHKKYLNNKIFHQRLTNKPLEDPKLRKLERIFNIRTCILYFYCNPLYKQPFDEITTYSLYEKLKRLESSICHHLPDCELKRNYIVKDASLPEFLIYGNMNKETDPLNLELLYRGILEKESKNEIKTKLIWQKFLKLSIILGFAVRAPFMELVKTLKFSNRIAGKFKHINHISELWKTINILSFQTNFLIFNKGIREIIRGKSEIVDLSAFVMLIGDDFIDQIARKTGTEKIIALISRKNEAFEIKINADFTLQSNDLVQLYRTLNIEKEKVSEKDNMTFDQLYVVMIEIFSEINKRLLKIELKKRQVACEAISSFFNYCLSTYMDDLLFSARAKDEKCRLSDTNWYFYKKNNCVMMYSLWLRAMILEIKYEDYLPQIMEWGNLVENIQLYDDLKDMKADWDFQPNYPLMISFEYFRDEYEWFAKNIANFSGSCTMSEIVEISVAMPKTVAHTMLLSKSMGLTHLQWFTKFATNYCWKQNWNNTFLHVNGYTNIKGYNLSNHRIFADVRNLYVSESKEVDLVFHLLSKTHTLFEVVKNKEFYFDYLLMLCLHDSNFSKRFYLRTNFLHTYNVFFRFQFMKTGYRTQLLNRFMKLRKVAVMTSINQSKNPKIPENKIFSAELLAYIEANWI